MSSSFELSFLPCGSSVFTLGSSVFTPATEKHSCIDERHSSGSPAPDSEADSVVDDIDSFQRPALSQEIMSSAFVTSMFATPSSDDEGTEGVNPYAGPVHEKVAAPMSAVDFLEALVEGAAELTMLAEDWKVFDSSGLLGIENWRPSCGGCEPGAFPLESLGKNGFAVHPPDETFQKTICPLLEAAINQLTSAGWPPVFVFVFDELWTYIAQYVQPAMGAVLGPACLLEPSIYCWALGCRSRAGASFNLPHRDYPHAEAFDARGRPAIMNVWVPLTPATLDNGCMYVLPKVFVCV